MLSSIKQKMTMIYILLIFIPLGMINLLAVENTRKSVLTEVEVNALKTANIISNLSRDQMNSLVTLKRIVKQYGPALGGRILILNSNKVVLADSSHLMEDKILDNQEVREALKSQEKIGYYSKDREILQGAVPIISGPGEEKRILGVVVFSLNVTDSFQQIKDFRMRLMGISITASILGIFVAIVVSNRIAKPIVLLSNVAKRIGEGHLGEQVEVLGQDEIGRLAKNFNFMSRELYEIDRNRTQFIGDVSHELKTPLASIKALIDSLLYGEDDIEIYQEYLRDMDTEIDRLTNLVQNLLNLTRIQEQQPNLNTIALRDLVLESTKLLKPLAENNGVKIDVNLQDPPLVSCDGERIKEVFINLIDNALKYMDPSKEEKNIFILGERIKGGYEIKIKDNGIGIEEKYWNLIFEKFYRADTSRSRHTGGAGIGLSIVSGILKRHGWSIKVESQLGTGSVFSIIIPHKSFKISL